MAEGGNVPDWAVAFLHAIKADREATVAQAEEMKLNTNRQMIAFKELKAQKESEFQQNVRLEAARINEEIIKAHETITDLQKAHQGEFLERRMETTKVDGQISIVIESLKMLTEEYNLLAMDLASLKKMDMELEAKLSEQRYKELSTRPRQASAQESVPDQPAPRPARNCPHLPAGKWLSEAARDPIPRSASRVELVTAVNSDKINAQLEVWMRPDFLPLQVFAEVATNTFPNAELDVFARALMRTYEIYGKDYEAIEAAIKQDIANAQDASVVLRSSSFAGRMLVAYGRMHAKEYLTTTIRQEVLKVVREGKSMEIDPEKLAPRENVEDNMRLLKGTAQAILVEICNSNTRMPMQLRRVCFLIRREMTKKYPSEVASATASFIFARVFCLAIANPEDYSLNVGEIDKAPRRGLALVSQIIQGAAVNANFKQGWMMSLNVFVSNNIAFVKKFYLEIAKVSDNGIWSASPMVTTDDIGRELLEASATIPLPVLMQVDVKLTETDKVTKFARPLMFNMFDRFNLLVDALVATQILQNATEPNEFVGDLMDFLLMEDHVFLDTVAGTVAAKTFTPELIASLANALTSLFVYYDNSGTRAVEDLVKWVSKKEFASPTAGPETRRKLLGPSLTGNIFKHLAKLFGKEFLQRIFVPALEAIRKSKAFSKLDKKGLQFISGILDTVKKELSNCPVAIWKMMSFLSRQPIEMAMPLFITKLVASGLDSVETYYTRIELKEKEKLLKKIGRISFALTKLGSGEEVSKTDDKNCSDINSWIKTSYDSLSKDVLGWASSNQGGLPPTKPMISWEEVRPQLKVLVDFFNAELVFFEAAFNRKCEQPLAYTLAQMTYAAAVQIKPRHRGK